MTNVLTKRRNRLINNMTDVMTKCTCHGVMAPSIVYHTYISICKGDVMTYVILLQHLGVQQGDVEAPHTAGHIKDDLITPGLSPGYASGSP